MGQALRQEVESSEDLRRIDEDLAKTAKELDLEMAQAALDAVGIVDPTPTSDLASAAMSAARGDWLGCGLSLISVVPYVGDAIAKPLKGTKAAMRLAKLADKLAGLKAMRSKVLAVRQKAADRVRELREKAKRAKLDRVKQNCPEVNPFGTRTPQSGHWSSQRGDSTWTPGRDTRNRRKIEKITGGKPIEFRKGHPNFSPYVYKGPPGKGEVKIHMTGDDATDFAMANKAAGFDEPPEGFTWHHKEDGTTMQLIPSDLHNNVPHTGGASIVNDKRY